MSKKWQVHIEALEAKAMQDKKEQEEHIQQVTKQNTTLIEMSQDHQKKIEELMSTNKTLINQMTGPTPMQESSGKKLGEAITKQGMEKKLCIKCKNWVYHTSNKCYTLDKNKHNHP